MPRFFFHVQDAKDLPDEEGTEFASADQASAQAVTFMGEALKDAVPMSLQVIPGQEPCIGLPYDK